jgi:16S rRNA (cytosine1402-N4)-methyltransferase
MTRHIPVLLSEVIESLQLKPGYNVIDCTLGDGGHSEAILEKIGPNGKLLGIDADPESVLRAKQYLYRFGERANFARDNFENIKQITADNNFHPVNGILLDLGWSTPQFKERGRGFSFDGDEPLDMRFGGMNQKGMTAAEIINDYSLNDLKRIFRQYGEEKLAEPIAKEIVERRKKEKIETTGQLTETILSVYRTILKSDKEIPWVGGLHPATKIYQALRIETNRELDVVRNVLPDAVEVLEKGGRLAVITFHSLEDRIVKHFVQSKPSTLKMVNKKPIIAGEEELKNNPSARSAKLRIIEKI